jgi:ABC-2 type transport system permease protein
MRVLGGLMLMLLTSVFILVLSCLLGWVVAKVSLKLKNKNIVVVILSLVFIGAYYFLYFKASEYIRDLIANAAVYGDAVREKAWFVYTLGRVGEGNLAAMVLFFGIVALLAMLMWIVLKQSFIGIATATGKTRRKVYRERAVKQKSVQAALYEKEYRRFLSSANYMLNTGLSTIFLLLGGAVLLWKGRELVEVLEMVFGGAAGSAAVLLATIVCFAASMNDMAAPSVSLEGKQLWLSKSLPVSARDCLMAKLKLQLRLTTIPTLFCSVCAATALSGGALETLTVVGFPVLFSILMACFDLTIGTARANVRWTNEMAPVKQSLPVFLALMGGWVFAAIPGVVYLKWGEPIGFPLYLALVFGVYAAVAALLFLWLRTKGAKKFEELD